MNQTFASIAPHRSIIKDVERMGDANERLPRIAIVLIGQLRRARQDRT